MFDDSPSICGHLQAVSVYYKTASDAHGLFGFPTLHQFEL